MQATIPDVILKMRVCDEGLAGPNPFGWQDCQSHDEWAGKTITALSIPGALTPPCSNEECPGLERFYAEVPSAGADEVCGPGNDLDALRLHVW